MADVSTVEIISCVWSDCDFFLMTGGAGGPTLLSNFFSEAPGPRAQIVFTSGVTPSDGQFDFNGFASMKWFAIEIPAATAAFNLRGVTFSGNGTNRDVLLSHTTGDVQLNILENGDTAGVTNGATITVTMFGACDVLAVMAGTWANALGTETNDLSSAVNPLVTQTTASLAADDDTFAIAAVSPGLSFNDILDYSGASDQYEDGPSFNEPSIGGGVGLLQGIDEVSFAAATRTGFPVYAGVESEGVQGIVHVDAADGGVPVVNLDALSPSAKASLRPWQIARAVSTLTFSYGAGNGDATKGSVDAKRFLYVSVVAIDGTAANTAVSSIVLNRSGGTTALSGRTTSFPAQDDNTGASGPSLELDVYDYDVDTGGQDLDQGTYDVVVSVSIEISGVTEGTRCSMIGDGGAEDGVELLAGYADSTGKVSGSFGGITPQDVIVKARNSGIINAAILEDNGTGNTDFTNEAREQVGADDVDLLPAVPALNDAFYYGGIAQFGAIELNVTTAGDTYVLTWEYWNGATWAALTVVDPSSSYFTLGWHIITFTPPGDWDTTSFNSQGPFFYVRARATTGGGTQPQAEKIDLNKTTKYLSFSGTGEILSTGLVATAVWVEDTIAN